MREVIAGKLWIGNAGDARNVARVLSAGVTAIIDLAIEESPVVYPRDISYCRIPLLDGPGNPAARLELAIGTASHLIEAGTPTLIVCGGGMSRAPAIATAALSRAAGIDLQQALADVVGTGPRDLAAGLWADVQAIVAGRSQMVDGV
ncbi:MAG: dual specificity protein phosphatase [Planctomycetaceae bacterium]